MFQKRDRLKEISCPTIFGPAQTCETLRVDITHIANNDAVPTKPIRTKPEAAEFLRIKPRTLDDWMRKKRIQFCKLPSGAVRFRTDQLLAFLSKFEVK